MRTTGGTGSIIRSAVARKAEALRKISPNVFFYLLHPLFPIRRYKGLQQMRSVGWEIRVQSIRS
jgi:hypothetical protein